MTAPTTPAIAFAAKSTEDRHGSIPNQLEDCRALAEREGLAIVAEFHDEAASAFSGDRGPGLARATAEAERLAQKHGSCALIVQHSDRLARGDGRAARHLVEYALWAIKADVTIRSVQDPQTFGDLLYAVVTGQRNHEDSARKSAATRDGLRRRRERGAPVGAVPLGYAVDRQVIDGAVITRRVVDPVSSPTIERIFALVEGGSTFGDVARALNAEGAKGRRGKSWTSRTVRTIVHNAAYKGEKGYPTIIDTERFDRIQEGLTRLDPAALQRRHGGRKPVDDSFFLRGVLFCARCGGTMYTRQQKAGRVYVCRERRQGTGLCDAPVIPAQLIETHVLNHLTSFMGSVERWLDEQVQEHAADRDSRATALDRERAALRTLEGQREKHMAEYRRMVAEEDRLARYALEEVERLDQQRDEQQRRIEEAEAALSEWEGTPDLDEALDFYNELVALVAGEIEHARGAAALNRKLSQLLAGLWAEFETERDRLLVEFELRLSRDQRSPGGDPVLAQIASRRPTLPPLRAGHQPIDNEVETVLRERANPGLTPRSTAA